MALDGELVGEHNKAKKELFTEGRVFVGSVRNPWDWYVSLWGFGCDGKGGLLDRLTQSRRPRDLGWRGSPLKALNKYLSSRNSQAWLAVYRDANDSAAFREWLHSRF